MVLIQSIGSGSIAASSLPPDAPAVAAAGECPYRLNGEIDKAAILTLKRARRTRSRTCSCMSGAPGY
jgi:hypothetical protein